MIGDEEIIVLFDFVFGGIIGFVGWSIVVVIHAGEYYRTVFECYSNGDAIVMYIFVLMAIVGLILAIKQVISDRK